MLKKEFLIFMFTSLNLFQILCAQNCLEFKSTNTDVNMSVFIHEEASLSLQELGINSLDTLGLFFDDFCVGMKKIENNFFAFSLWGDDINTDIQDGLNAGELPTSWLVKSTDNIIYHLTPGISETQQNIGWENDGILEITYFQLDSISTYGCTDPTYMEYWDLNNSPDCNDGSCNTPLSGQLVNEFSTSSSILNSLYDTIDIYQNSIDLTNQLNDSLNIINESIQENILELTSTIDSVSNQLTVQESENLSLFDSLNLTQLNISYLSNSIDSIYNINESLQENITEVTNTIDSVSNQLTILESENLSLYDSIGTYNNEVSMLNNKVDSLTNPILIDLDQGWNIIGFVLLQAQELIGSLEMIDDEIILLKNNDGNVYMPEYNFNGIGMLIPGQGYQLKITEAIDNFYFYNIY